MAAFFVSMYPRWSILSPTCGNVASLVAALLCAFNHDYGLLFVLWPIKLLQHLVKPWRA